MSLPSPSQIARRAASDLWGPGVQTQKRVCKGTYLFSTAGHGGYIAVVGTAALDPAALEAARADGNTEIAIVAPGRRNKLYTSVTHDADGLRAFAAEHNLPVFELVIGEEDAQWAVVALVQQDLTKFSIGTWEQGGRPDGWLERYGSREYALDTARRWNPEFAAAIS